MQRAFIEHDGYQCGYCTPGQIVSAVGMLDEVEAGWPSHVTQDLNVEEISLDDAEIRERMSGNLCRCAAYANIVPAIREVSDDEAIQLRARPRRRRAPSRRSPKRLTRRSSPAARTSST